MPSLPSSSRLWKKHLLYFLGFRKNDDKTHSLCSSLYPMILIVICTLSVCGLNSLFQWLVFTSRDNNWKDMIQAIPRVLFFVPFDILYAIILYQNTKVIMHIPWYIIFILVTLEGTGTWLLSFYFIPCAYGVDCHSQTGTVNVYLANWNLAINFTPHIWMWMISEIIASLICTFLCNKNKKRRDIHHNDYYIQLTKPSKFEELEHDMISVDNVNHQTTKYWLCLCIIIINILIFLMLFIIFCATQMLCGSSIWSLEFNPNLTSAKIYFVYLTACTSGKYLMKRMSRFIDKYCLQINGGKINDNLLKGMMDHKLISIEVLIEIHITIIYNVIFRFLFPVIVSIYEFIVIKIFHILGDIMHNWIRRSSYYFKYTLYLQNNYLYSIKCCYVNSIVDECDQYEWNVRILLDCTLRFLISCCEGCIVLLLDSFVLPSIFGWNVNMSAVYYTAISVVIDSIIFILALFVVGNKMILIKGSDPLFVLLTNTYGLYTIYFVVSMAFSVCFFGIPAAMFD